MERTRKDILQLNKMMVTIIVRGVQQIPEKWENLARKLEFGNSTVTVVHVQSGLVKQQEDKKKLEIMSQFPLL